jgi:hypothetical protein
MSRFAFAAALLMAPSIAWAECASEDRAAMAQMGYTTTQIDALCNSVQDAFAPPQAAEAFYCTTQYAFCPLQAPAPVGSPCLCASLYGPIPGIAE